MLWCRRMVSVSVKQLLESWLRLLERTVGLRLCSDDPASDYPNTRLVLQELCITDVTLDDCKHVQHICWQVSQRAAKLAATGEHVITLLVHIATFLGGRWRWRDGIGVRKSRCAGQPSPLELCIIYDLHRLVVDFYALAENLSWVVAVLDKRRFLCVIHKTFSGESRWCIFSDELNCAEIATDTAAAALSIWPQTSMLNLLLLLMLHVLSATAI